MSKQPSIHQNAINFTEVTVGHLTYFFSYDTIVGFQKGYEKPVVSENIWSATTGKHINMILPGSKDQYTKHEKFLVLLAEAEGWNS